MAKKSYEVGEGGAEYASAQSGLPVEVGDTVELDIETDVGLVAAGWLIPADDKKKKGDK